MRCLSVSKMAVKASHLCRSGTLSKSATGADDHWVVEEGRCSSLTFCMDFVFLLLAKEKIISKKDERRCISGSILHRPKEIPHSWIVFSDRDSSNNATTNIASKLLMLPLLLLLLPESPSHPSKPIERPFMLKDKQKIWLKRNF